MDNTRHHRHNHQDMLICFAQLFKRRWTVGLFFILIFLLTHVYIHLYINGSYINLYINLAIHLIYKQLRLYINLYIKKQHVFLLHNDDLYSIYTFKIKSSLI